MSTTIPRIYAPDSCFELLWLECINLIARGTNRDVFKIPDHNDKVLKVSNRQANFANWSEITTYIQSQNSSYLAKIHSRSASGKFLVMEKLISVTLADLSWLQFPAYINDRKPDNFGRDSSGNIKVLDYGMLDLSSMPTRYFP